MTDTNDIKFDVFGRHILVTRTEGGWTVNYAGDQGKKRPATDILIPDFISEDEIEQYLTDLCHEWATDRYTDVRRID